VRKTSLFEMGEVSNSSKETDKSRMDFLRGKRGGMFGKVLEGGYYMNCAKSLTISGISISNSKMAKV